jgi:hypothetical protein
MAECSTWMGAEFARKQSQKQETVQDMSQR